AGSIMGRQTLCQQLHIQLAGSWMSSTTAATFSKLFYRAAMRIRGASFRALVSSAYDLSGNLETWFQRAVSSFRAHLDQGHGGLGVLVQRPRADFVHIHLDGAHP